MFLRQHNLVRNHVSIIILPENVLRIMRKKKEENSQNERIFPMQCLYLFFLKAVNPPIYQKIKTRKSRKILLCLPQVILFLSPKRRQKEEKKNVSFYFRGLRKKWNGATGGFIASSSLRGSQKGWFWYYEVDNLIFQ